MIRRVLFPYVGDSVGGSHISSTLLIAYLDPARYRPVVLLQQEGPLAERLQRMGIGYEVTRLPELAGEVPGLVPIARAGLRSLLPAIALLRRHEIDLVHTNDLRMHLTWSLPARMSGRPWVWHQRMLLSGSPLWRILPWAAAHVFCISQAVCDTLPVQKRIAAEVLYNPVELDAVGQDDYRPRLLAETGATADAVLVGFVGNMTGQKRPLMFIETAALLVRQSSRPLHFILFGDDRGGQRGESERLAAEHGIADRVHFMGHRSPIEPWIAGLDLLLAPGVGDGFGRTLVEAMIGRTPVIAVASGGHREIVEDGRTGWLVPVDDPAALAEKVVAVLDDSPALALVVDNAYKHAVAAYSAEQHAARVMDVYDGLGGRRGGGRRDF